jgi:hypothetical protein
MPSPEFTAIRQTSHNHTRIHTVRIWEQIRSQFGPGQIGSEDVLPTLSTASSCSRTGRKTPTSPTTDGTSMISAELLRRIRNDLPMAVTIAALGRGGPPSKFREGRFVFLCPHGGELLAAVNPRNNLAHCFACRRNLNNIDLLRQLGHNFLSAVALLEQWLDKYQAQRPN